MISSPMGACFRATFSRPGASAQSADKRGTDSAPTPSGWLRDRLCLRGPDAGLRERCGRQSPREWQREDRRQRDGAEREPSASSCASPESAATARVCPGWDRRREPPASRSGRSRCRSSSVLARSSRARPAGRRVSGDALGEAGRERCEPHRADDRRVERGAEVLRLAGEHGVLACCVDAVWDIRDAGGVAWAGVRRQPGRPHRPNGMNRGSCGGTVCRQGSGAADVSRSSPHRAVWPRHGHPFWAMRFRGPCSKIDSHRARRGQPARHVDE